jgi:pimeloyl-ACP methyl ester carboxylesterase
MPDVPTRTGKVHYEKYGETSDIGPTVMLHGMGMASSSYVDVVPGLAERGEVYTIDTPGHGLSEVPADDGEFPVERIADAIVDALDAIGLDKVNVVGNSLGAMTAVEIGAAYPDRVRKLVLVGCPGWDGRFRSERIAARKAGTMPRPDPNAPVTAESLKPTFTAPTDELAERVALARQQSSPFSERGGGAVMSHDTLGRSFYVKAPVLLLCGERDIVVPDQFKFERSMPQSKLVLFDNAAHYPQVDNPPLFVDTVAKFLAE